LNILQSKYGLEGIGFFTNLMRFLALTPDHHYCIKDETDKMNFFAEIGIQDESRGLEMIELMVKTEKLDRELWEGHKVIACQAFLESLKPAYEKRNNKVITIDEIRAKFIKGERNPLSDPGNSEKSDFDKVSGDDNTQSKVKKSKVKKSKYISDSDESQKDKKPPLRERDPSNDMERVEKVYRQNWDALFAQKKVKTVNPIVNWNKTRKQLKTHFEKLKPLKPEQIIQAVNNGMTDDFVLRCGYSLGVMLSAEVLNRLINAGGQGPPAALADKKPLSGLTSIF
jgi:uncharacterized protein YktA (UPF0223 family)